MSPHLIVLTLVWPEGQPAQQSSLDPLLESALAPIARIASHTELVPDRAWDYHLHLTSPEALPQVGTSLETQLNAWSLDWALHPDPANRIKRLIVSDMDSTLITGECIDELAEVAGIKSHVAQITERAMRGELDFEQALRERVGLLAGLPVTAIEQVLSTTRLMPGAATFMATMKQLGAHRLVVSGGFEPFTERVCQVLEMDGHQANRLESDPAQGTLTGQVLPPILGQQAKLSALQTTASQLNLPLSQTMAVGDGANDLAMIQAAGMGVAYYAKPAVMAAAGYRVAYGDWTTLLCYQGIPASQWCVRPATHLTQE